MVSSAVFRALLSVARRKLGDKDQKKLKDLKMRGKHTKIHFFTGIFHSQGSKVIF